MNPRKSISNRFDKDELHPEQADHCQLKYLNVCTSPLFEGTLADKCKKVELARLYREIAIEFSRVAISGGGDRNCVFHIGTMPCEAMNFFGERDFDQFLAKFAQLSSAIFDKCGKDSFRAKWQPKVRELFSLANQQSGCSVREEVSAQLEVLSSAAPPRTKGYTTLSNGMCLSRSYSHRSLAIFVARSFSSTDPETARDRFQSFSKQIATLGKKYVGARAMRANCDLESSGRMPCELLKLPHKEVGCQLAHRAQRLFEYVGKSCNEVWINFY